MCNLSCYALGWLLCFNESYLTEMHYIVKDYYTLYALQRILMTYMRHRASKHLGEGTSPNVLEPLGALL